MGKMALVIKKSELPIYEAVNPELCDALTAYFCDVHVLSTDKIGLMDRSLAETDTNYLQIIPYITLSIIGPDGKKYTYMYVRGEKSEEGRLTGKCSIGLGGHIEENVSKTKNLVQVVRDTAVRELQEEIGIDLSSLVSTARINWMYVGLDDVSSVHMAAIIDLNLDQKRDQLFIEYALDGDYFTGKFVGGGEEEGVITKGIFIPLEHIADYVEENNVELEAWSVIALTILLHGPQLDSRECNEES